MRVEARDGQKPWKPGHVTCVNPLKVKLDTELSGVSWDEVRPYDEAARAKEKSAGALSEFMKGVQEDAQKMVQQAKEGALADLKFALQAMQEIANKEDPSVEALKGAKMRVAEAMKAAQAKGVSKEELVEASRNINNAEEKIKEEAIKGEKPVKAKKEKKPPPVIEFENPAVGEAVKEAALKAKEEEKSMPEIIKAAVEAAQAVEGASAEDVKKAKKAAVAACMDESSSSSSDSDDSSDTEVERELDKMEKEKAKREGIAAAFYFNAK